MRDDTQRFIVANASQRSLLCGFLRFAEAFQRFDWPSIADLGLFACTTSVNDVKVLKENVFISGDH